MTPKTLLCVFLYYNSASRTTALYLTPEGFYEEYIFDNIIIVENGRPKFTEKSVFLLEHSATLLRVSSGCWTSVILDFLPVLAGCYCPSESCWSSAEWCPGGSAAGQTAWLQTDGQTDRRVTCSLVFALSLIDDWDNSDHKRYRTLFCTFFTCFCQCRRIRREIRCSIETANGRAWQIGAERLNDKQLLWALRIFDQCNLLSCAK